MRAIGLDIGTSSIKAAVLDLERSAISDARSIPFCEPIAGLPSLHVEIGPRDVMARVRDVLNELATTAGGNFHGLFCCTQMQGLLLIDDQRRAVSNYISWRDERVTKRDDSSNVHQSWVSEHLGTDRLRKLGNEFRPGYPLNLISWLKRNRQLPPDQLTALGLGDYVLMELCGTAPAAHRTTAAGAIDLTTGNWLADGLDVLEVDTVRWPQLVGTERPIGEWRPPGSSRPIQCFPAIGDHPCALAGIGLEEGELSINVSTGSQVSALTCDLQIGEGYQTRPFIDGRFLNTMTHLPAGRALNVLIALLTEAAPGADLWPQIERAIETTPQTDLNVNLAFFTGPAGNDGGHIAKIGVHNFTLGHLFRGAINNMTDNYAAAANRLGDKAKWSRIVFSGGLAQKIDALRDRVLDRIGLPGRVSAETEETLRGLLRIAQRAKI